MRRHLARGARHECCRSHVAAMNFRLPFLTGRDSWTWESGPVSRKLTRALASARETAGGRESVQQPESKDRGKPNEGNDQPMVNDGGEVCGEEGDSAPLDRAYGDTHRVCAVVTCRFPSCALARNPREARLPPGGHVVEIDEHRRDPLQPVGEG